MRKTLVSLMLVCVLAAALIPAVGEQSVTSEKVFVVAGYAGSDTQQDMSSNLFFQRMLEITGVRVDFKNLSDFDAWTEEKAKLFAGNDLPDAVFGASLTTQETISYYQDGKLIDLNPLLQENAPNLYALLEANPNWRKAITLPDGAIVALPAINTLRDQNAMWINKVWLDKLKLDMPTDAASLKAVLEAFKTQDPNYNGRSDEIPFTFIGSWDLKFLAHAFGLTANDYNMFVDSDGNAQFMPASSQYKEFVAWAKELYDAGLLDKNGFSTSDTMRKVTDEKAAVTFGMFFGPSATTFLPSNQAQEYVILSPLQYEGSKVYRDLLGTVFRGTFAITSACKDPATLLSWVDYLYTEEGGRLALLGQENAEYAYNENGTWRWIPPVEELTSVIESATLRSSNSYPLLNPVDFQLLFEDEKIVQYIRSVHELGQVATLPFPQFTLSKEQLETISPMQLEIGRYVDESLAKFVIGETDLNDETWQEYLDNLDGMGLSPFVSFWQKVLSEQTL